MIGLVCDFDAQGLFGVVDAGIVLSGPLQRLFQLLGALCALGAESLRWPYSGDEFLVAGALALLELSLELKYVGLFIVLQLL